jgi:hypothetical protein
VGLLSSENAAAGPARIIILRHGEKLNASALCKIGVQRGEALAKQFLGRGATQSLLRADEVPAAILGITLHTIETITPVAQTWGLPVTAYSVVPGSDDGEKETDLNERTKEAARDVLTNPNFAGKTVIMVWEHKHVAKRKLEEDYPNEQVTLRQLLHLDQLKDVPKNWPDENYDFFWIVEYGSADPVPTRFRMLRQDFTAPFDKVPANDWDEAEPKHHEAGRKK